MNKDNNKESIKYLELIKQEISKEKPYLTYSTIHHQFNDLLTAFYNYNDREK